MMFANSRRSLEAGIAAEDSENADPLVRGDGGPLALDGIGRG